ncbi:MAG: hypothetical protein ACP5EN_12690 [Rhodovulum sp.]
MSQQKIINFSPRWCEPGEARVDLRTAMDEAFDRSVRYHDNPVAPAPAFAFKVSPGLGKTSTALRLLGQHAAALLEHGHVAVYVPTLDLADRASEDFRLVAPTVPCEVIRGRDAMNPETGVKMCCRSDLVRRISGLVPSITRAVCEGRHEGEVVKAPCARGCPYLAQRNHRHRVLFTAHAYLNSGVPVPGDIALQIIDEKVWSTLAHVRSLSVEDWLSDPFSDLDSGLSGVHRVVRMKLLEALIEGRPVLETLRQAGVSKDDLEALSRHEFETAPVLELRPDLLPERNQQRIDGFDRHAWSICVGRGQIFRQLSACFDRETTDRLSLSQEDRNGQRRKVIRLHRCRTLSEDIPTLFLDADADPDITDLLRPGTVFQTIEARPRAEVVQTTESTLSNAYLLHPQQGKARRVKVLSVLRREVERAAGQGVLVVATKAVLSVLHADIGQTATETDDDLARPLLGATARWFGPRMQGVNDFENYATIVVVGRLQPSVAAVEDMTRCLFGDEEKGLVLPVGGSLKNTQAKRLMADGNLTPAKIQDHPDARASSILYQMRECQSLQAIARLRLISADRPKRVVILGNLVLPGLPVNCETTLDALAEGLEGENDIAGYRRLVSALGTGPRPHVRGFRLSAAGLVQDLPKVFLTEGRAHSFRRHRPTAELLHLVGRLADRHAWPASAMKLAPASGGRAVPAVVFSAPSEAMAIASRLWPSLTADPVSLRAL